MKSGYKKRCYRRRTARRDTSLKILPAAAQCSRIRIFRFFSDFKKHDFLRFIEMTYQKVVKSHQQKFSHY